MSATNTDTGSNSFPFDPSDPENRAISIIFIRPAAAYKNFLEQCGKDEIYQRDKLMELIALLSEEGAADSLAFDIGLEPADVPAEVTDNPAEAAASIAALRTVLLESVVNFRNRLLERGIPVRVAQVQLRNVFRTHFSFPAQTGGFLHRHAGKRGTSRGTSRRAIRRRSRKQRGGFRASPISNMSWLRRRVNRTTLKNLQREENLLQE